MSAQGLKELTRRETDKMREQHLEALVGRTEDTLDQMRLNQGIVIGMQMVLDAMDEAYKKIGE